MSRMHGKAWGNRYTCLAKEISTWSKDPSTQVGAVVIGNNGEVLSQGYNGFPRGIKDTAACAGSFLSRINFLALKNIKNAIVPEIAGETTQLAAMVPTLSQETA